MALNFTLLCNYSNNSYIYHTNNALRKYTSIVLLLILLFNIAGYRAWFYYAEQKSDAAVESMLDKDQYNESELIALTIPLNNPYQIEQSAYERVNGEISFQGRTYKLVKRKISDGTLVLLCIPDAHKMVLKKAGTEFGNATGGLAAGSKNSSRSHIQKNFSGSDYLKLFANPDFGKLENNSLVYHPFHPVYNPDPQVAAPGKPPQAGS